MICGYRPGSQVEEYDTTTGEWTSWPELTVGRNGHSCSVIGDTVVIAGGADDNDNVLESTTLLDISSRTQRPGGNMASARVGLKTVNHEGKLLAIGGITQDLTVLKTVEEWDPTEEVWTPREDLDITIPRTLRSCVRSPLHRLR